MKPFLAMNAMDDDDLPAGLMYILRQFVNNQLDTCLPAKVIAYDRDSNRATIKPLINRVTTDTSVYERSQITNVPVLANGAGGFVLNFPVVPGDVGWIVAADRDISLFKQSLSESAPTTARLHTFADCWFIPDVFGEFTIKGDDAGRAVLQSNNGFCRVSIGSADIKIHAGASTITITDSSVTVETTDTQVTTKTFKVDTDTAVINAKGTTINSPTTINGGLTVNAGAGGAGVMVSNIDMTVKSIKSQSFISGANNVDLVTHKHIDSTGHDTQTPKS